MRLLTEIKQCKGQVVKLSGYNTMMMKQVGNMTNLEQDVDIGNIFANTVV